MCDRAVACPRAVAWLESRAGDFFYAEHNLVVYVDGPPHDFPERAERDAKQQSAMEDLGYVVVRFLRHDADWEGLIKLYPSVFGVGN